MHWAAAGGAAAARLGVCFKGKLTLEQPDQ